MASDNWKSLKIGEFAEVKGGKRLPRGKKLSEFKTEHPYIRIVDFHDSRISLSKLLYVPENVFPDIERYTVDSGNIVISIVGTIGLVAIIPPELHKASLTENAAKILVVNKEIDQDYIFWYLKSPLGQQEILKNIVGSTQPKLPLYGIKNVEVSYPPLQTQKKIAHILSTLDEKIELNRKMNETLEAMAQEIFKSWFVDFDPVHAKAGCRNEADLEAAAKALGISREVLELFPSEFAESEIGMIPKGWKTKPLDQIAHYQNGLALQKFRPQDEAHYLPVLKIAQLKKGYADGEEKADPNIKPECIVDNGDVIFSWSGSLVVDIWCGGKVALNQHLFKVTSKQYAKWFYYLWTKQHLFNFQRVAAAKAVTMGHIKRSHLTEALCAIPSDKIFYVADQIIGPLIAKLIDNRIENNNLQQTRDTLLPKLLSGELDVSEVEI